jgi:hypothetical protein
MTWHAKALTTSYITAPGVGTKGESEDEAVFSFSTASWYFLDALDMMAPADARTIVAFGDSITDGTASTMNSLPDDCNHQPGMLHLREQMNQPGRSKNLKVFNGLSRTPLIPQLPRRDIALLVFGF